MVRTGNPRGAGVHVSLTTVLTFSPGLFGMVSAQRAWHVEVHQFRIEARSGEAGRPTPEGCIATASTTCWCCW